MRQIHFIYQQEPLKRCFLSKVRKLLTNKLALRISTCLVKTWKLFYSLSVLWKSSAPSQYHPPRPFYITQKQNLSLFAGSFLPCPRGTIGGIRWSDCGGPTLFRSHISNFLSALGCVYQFIHSKSHFSVLTHSVGHSISTQGLKIRYHVRSRVSKMRFLFPLLVTAVPVLGKNLSAHPPTVTLIK